MNGDRRKGMRAKLPMAAALFAALALGSLSVARSQVSQRPEPEDREWQGSGEWDITPPIVTCRC